MHPHETLAFLTKCPDSGIYVQDGATIPFLHLRCRMTIGFLNPVYQQDRWVWWVPLLQQLASCSFVISASSWFVMHSMLFTIRILSAVKSYMHRRCDSYIYVLFITATWRERGVDCQLGCVNPCSSSALMVFCTELINVMVKDEMSHHFQLQRRLWWGVI